MLDALYEWVQNMVFFLLLAGMLLDVLPGNSYRKYVRFFAGTVVILLLVSPLLRLSGIKQSFDNIYHSKEYENMLRKVEFMESYFEEAAEEFWQNEVGGEGTNAGMDGMDVGGVNTEDAGIRGTDVGNDDEKGIKIEEVRIGE